MPLVKSSSKAAREKNIETEIAAGKKPKQAVAIGYAVQRRAAGGKKSKKAAPKGKPAPKSHRASMDRMMGGSDED